METIEHTASWPRRMLAILVDWVACSLVALLILGTDSFGKSTYSWVVLGIFWLESSVGTALAGGSFGQLATRLRVLTTSYSPVPLIAAVVRQLLICVVIPPLVFRPDGRGLHDLAVGSATYDLKALEAR
ncbi:hypothetical protein GCM10011519_00520 [Marmoricola endophyticus]|uniref:RDD family protein n=1 Tax=Marmoricola endophyticus TaxID=2040280 RepID=A0A917B942_9ACTN|nr:RDD family protein [Marmoricola endophyticus]GGF30988.1 hypothetical protein GCM10011519_00520 [Marmoricola endophyticus]